MIELTASHDLRGLRQRVIALFGEEAYAAAVTRAMVRLRLTHGAVAIYGLRATKHLLPMTFRDNVGRELRALLREH